MDRKRLGPAARMALAAAIVVAPMAIAAPVAAEESLATADEFREAFEETRRSIENMTTVGVEDILEIVTQGVGTVRQLRTRVEQGEQVDLEHIAGSLEELAASFEQAAALAPRVFQTRLEEIRDLDGIQRQLGINVRELDDDIARLRQERERWGGEIQALEAGSIDRKKLDVLISRNDALIHSRTIAMQNWEAFMAKHAGALELLRDQDGVIELLFLTLEANAEVYGQAAQTARITQQASDTLRKIDEIAAVGGVVNDLVQSWSDLDRVMDELRAEFGQTTPSF